jgi:uncharacterized protein YbaR (Trm112 family)
MSTALEVKRVPHSEDLSHPGEFVFIPKREPIRKFYSEPLTPPTGAFRRLWWNWFGKKYEIKQIVELLWPEIDTVIINCPDCNQPLATTKNHAIVSLEPLTIETSLTCPYSKTHTFKVADGKIMTA